MTGRGFGAVTALAVATLAASAGMAVRADDSGLGRRVYEDNCAICHGIAGDGHGPAAQNFASMPRDFTQGRYKVRSTASGQPPTDEDLRQTVRRGLPGTGMVPHDHLTPTEVDAVVAFVKSLSPKFADRRPPAPLPIPAEPTRGRDATGIGRKVYDKAECQECHGREGRGDGPSAKDLKVKPADLTRRPFKGGSTARDIVKALITGYDGTPMPSYHLVLEDDELWHLAWYVQSLGGAPVMTDDERAGWRVVQIHQRRPGPWGGATR